MTLLSTNSKNYLTPLVLYGRGEGGEGLLVLAYYTLFSTENISTDSIMERIRECCGDFDKKGVVEQLCADGWLVVKQYDYRNSGNQYTIAPERMVRTMQWLYDTDEGHEVLNALKPLNMYYELDQTNIQSIVSEYIQSHYVTTSRARSIFLTDLPYLIPIADDDKFLLLLRGITEGLVTTLVQEVIRLAYRNATIVNAGTLRRLAETYRFMDLRNKNTLLATIDLYDYMATGHLDTQCQRYKTIPETHLLAAIYEAYHAHYEASLAHFAEAQKLYNARTTSIEARGIFPQAIINALHMIVCAHHGTEESLHQLDIMLRRRDSEATIIARMVCRIIRNSDMSRLNDDMRRLFVQGSRAYSGALGDIITPDNTMESQWVALLVCYAERKGVITDAALEATVPTWRIMQHEFSRFVTVPDDDANVILSAYGDKPLLTSIHRQEQWETTLNTLLAQLRHSPSATTGQQHPERVAYFMETIHDNLANARLQVITKSGGWSIGKTLPFHQFMTMSASSLLPGDIVIRQRNQNVGHINNFKLDLHTILPEMTNESRLFVGKSSPYTLVTVNEEVPYLVVERDATGFVVKSNVRLEQIDSEIIITSRSASSINYLKMTADQRTYFAHLLTTEHFPEHAEGRLSTFLTALGKLVEIHSPLIPGGTTLKTVEGTPALTIQLRPKGKEGYSVSIFCRPLEGGRVQCRPGEGLPTVIDIMDGRRVCVNRNLNAERAILEGIYASVAELSGLSGLSGKNLSTDFDTDAFTLLPLIDYVREHSDDIALEWPEGHKLHINRTVQTSQWQAALKKNKNGWFELEGELHIDDNTMLTVQQLMEGMKSNSQFIRIGDGEFIKLSIALRKQLENLDAFTTRQRGHLQMSRFTAALLSDDITNGELRITIDDELRQIRQRIIDLSDYRPEVPKGLNATLRPYQVEGFQWIARLNEWGAGALLADDMGLGKTIQTIAYMLLRADKGPQLVVAPASVAPNWRTELNRFAPSLNVEILNFAENRSRCIANAKAGDVIITTYNLLLSVKDEITQKEWTTVCLDEAHVIKNRGAKTSGVAMKLKAEARVMLTGTPVQNHLGELWNLFQFVNPGLLGSYEDYGRRFITPIEVANNKERRKALERLVQPFMLRRTKEKVLDELPDKTEIYQTVQLTDDEIAEYEAIRRHAEELLLAEEQQDRVSMNTLAEITHLRMAACAPSKTLALIEQLEPVIDSGGAALVFSQFTSYLAKVRQALEKANIPYLYIDGSVPVKERERLVNIFQKDLPLTPSFQDGEHNVSPNVTGVITPRPERKGSGEGPASVFLISLKAGGLGLNLTRANYVFHLDPWWNPAIEQQATDRAHRIGQHQAVTVYHMLASNTIEEKIRRLHERKRELSESILEGTDQSINLTGKELLSLIKN